MCGKRLGSVLVVGAGALGSRVIPRLAEAEIDRIGIVDGDIVTDRNKASQPAYSLADTSKVTYKSDFLASSLSSEHPGKRFDSYPFYIGTGRAESLTGEYDIVVDLTDNLQTRLVLNSVCVKLSKPAVFASIDEREGFFYVYSDGSACYNCIHRKAVGRINEGCDSSSVLPADGFVEEVVSGVLEPTPGSLRYSSFANYSHLVVEIMKDESCEVCSAHDYSRTGLSRFIQLCGSGVKVSLQRELNLKEIRGRLEGYSLDWDDDYLLASRDGKSVLISPRGDMLFTGYDKTGAETLLDSLVSASPG